MSIGFILLVQTTLTFVITGWLAKNFWFSYILFLVFIGGILILFIYIASISSNEKFNLSITNYIKIFIAILIFLIIIWILSNNFFIDLITNNNESILLSNNIYLIKENLLINSKIYNSPNNFITTFLINYLLLNLIIIVKITNLYEGPFRIKN